MFRRILWIAVIGLVGVLFAQKNAVKFNHVVKQLNVSKNTRLAVKNNWQNLKGTEVNWTARVVDVKGGRGKVQILAVHKGAKKYRGYNLVLTTFDIEAAAQLKKDQRIRFSGQLNKYKAKNGGLVILYLNEVELLTKK